jgi:hypothetical protein
MAQASRTDILNAKNKPVKVMIPGWVDGDPKAWVYVRPARGDDADEYQAICQEGVKGKNTSGRLQARWCALGVCDKKGRRLFTADDVDELLLKPFNPMQRCAIEVMRVNGLIGGERGKKGSPTDR